MLHRIVPFYALLSLTAVLCSAEEIRENPQAQNEQASLVLFTHGPGGPIRQGNRFFAGEQVFLLVGVPKSGVPEENIRLYCEISVVSKINRTWKWTTSTPVLLDGFAPGDGTCYLSHRFHLPHHFETGEYEFSLTVMDRMGKVLTEGKSEIRIDHAKTFGIRHPVFFHGLLGPPPQWAPGSNLYRTGEASRINISVGGTTPGQNGECVLGLDLLIVDEEGTSVDFLAMMNFPPINRHKPPENKGEFFTYNFTFSFSQPGRYTLKIKVKDLVAAKETTCELPFRVFDPFE